MQFQVGSEGHILCVSFRPNQRQPSSSGRGPPAAGLDNPFCGRIQFEAAGFAQFAA